MEYNNKPSAITDEEKTKAVENLARAINHVYLNPKRLFVRSFLVGVFTALGATIGVAIVLALLGMLIRQFGGLPIVGQWLIDISNFIPNN